MVSKAPVYSSYSKYLESKLCFAPGRISRAGLGSPPHSGGRDITKLSLPLPIPFCTWNNFKWQIFQPLVTNRPEHQQGLQILQLLVLTSTPDTWIWNLINSNSSDFECDQFKMPLFSGTSGRWGNTTFPWSIFNFCYRNLHFFFHKAPSFAWLGFPLCFPPVFVLLDWHPRVQQALDRSQGVPWHQELLSFHCSGVSQARAAGRARRGQAAGLGCWSRWNKKAL